MTIDNELIDNLLKDYKKPADLIGSVHGAMSLKFFKINGQNTRLAN